MCGEAKSSAQLLVEAKPEGRHTNKMVISKEHPQIAPKMWQFYFKNQDKLHISSWIIFLFAPNQYAKNYNKTSSHTYFRLSVPATPATPSRESLSLLHNKRTDDLYPGANELLKIAEEVHAKRQSVTGTAENMLQSADNVSQ